MLALANYGPLLYALPLAYLWFAGGVSGKKAVLLSLLSIALALLIAQVIGYLYFRPRPFAFHEVNLLVDKSPDPSFPSDHVTFSFAIASVIWLASRRAGIASIILGTLIAVARVFAGTHYPLDVLGGALIGSLSGWLWWKIKKQVDPLTSFVIRGAQKVKLA